MLAATVLSWYTLVGALNVTTLCVKFESSARSITKPVSLLLLSAQVRLTWLEAMALVFNGYELAALLLAALISTTLIADGESTWFEGVQLLGVYALLGLVFYYA